MLGTVCFPEKDDIQTASWGRTAKQVPVSKSHTRSVMSIDADTTRAAPPPPPPSTTAMHVTQLVWPGRVVTHVPLAMSHTRSVLSSDPDTTRAAPPPPPPSTTATHVTSLVWPDRTATRDPVSSSMTQRQPPYCGRTTSVAPPVVTVHKHVTKISLRKTRRSARGSRPSPATSANAGFSKNNLAEWWCRAKSGFSAA